MAEDHVQLDRGDFVKQYTEWFNKDQTRSMFSSDCQEVQEVLGGDELSYEQRISLSVKALCIGSHYCTQGALVCLEDAPRGWRLMKQGLLYFYWHDRIAYRARDFWQVPAGKQRKTFAHACELTNGAALGLAVARSEAIWLLDLMERSLTDGSLRWLGDDYYAAYLIRLHRKLKREEDIIDIPPDPQEWKTPFGDLIDYWDDDERLADAIRATCDYHLKWNYEETDEHDSEFSEPFTMVNPVEIHALEAVRSELGLSTPKVEHELLQPPFYPMPDFAKNISTEEILAEDDLLRRVVELNQPWCDGLDE